MARATYIYVVTDRVATEVIDGVVHSVKRAFTVKWEMTAWVHSHKCSDYNERFRIVRYRDGQDTAPVRLVI